MFALRGLTSEPMPSAVYSQRVSPESMMTPLGETLQRARLARGVTLQEAERTTRISRRYLEALENENFGLLPAPVYARGFLRTYARYLGLEPADLLPLFPVGYLDVPLLEPMPRVTTPRTWPGSGLLAAGVVAVLLIVVVGLYAMGGSEGGSQPLFGPADPEPGKRRRRGRRRRRLAPWPQ